jgi:hypothetical protein
MYPSCHITLGFTNSISCLYLELQASIAGDDPIIAILSKIGRYEYKISEVEILPLQVSQTWLIPFQ